MASRKATVATPGYEHSVFVNAPFDAEFLPLLHAILFTIHDAGFVARLAVEEVGGRELRLPRILRLIRESRLSIHDLSRVDTSNPAGLPRFNMPFECGLALGAIEFEEARAGSLPRNYLVMVAEPFQDQKTTSDLAGQDSIAHHNEVGKVIAAARRFLSAQKLTGEKTRGAAEIGRRFDAFKTTALLPEAARVGIGSDEIQSFDYIREWLQAAVAWQKANLT